MNFLGEDELVCKVERLMMTADKLIPNKSVELLPGKHKDFKSTTDDNESTKKVSLAKHNDYEMPPAKKQKQWELTIEDLKVVETREELKNDHIEFAQLLRNQFPYLNGLMTPLYQSKKQDSKPEKDHLQILFVGGNHWIFALTVQDHNTVAVYDSLHNTVNDSMSSNLFLPPNIQVRKSTKQAGVRDCGLFTIANAVAIANGVSPSTIKLNQTLMRIHLTQCFKDKHNFIPL